MKLILGLKQQIESIIGTSLDEYEITVEEWNQSAMQLVGGEQKQSDLLEMESPEEGQPKQEFASDAIASVKSLNTEERIYFKVKSNKNERTLVCWGCSASSITTETRRLIELLITNSSDRIAEELPVIYENNREQELAELGKWLRQKIEHPAGQESIPEHFSFRDELHSEKIPFLLQCETPDAHRIRSKELNKLLGSYFGEDIMLIPLGEQDWLFLSDEQIVTGEAEEDTLEAKKDLLNAFCLGLYELVASEWAGVFHLSASMPCIPVQELSTITGLLEESIHLGRAFHVAQHIHLPWELHLERLVASIPEQQRLRFIKETGKDTAIFEDSETLATLETYFSLDCNVSETAKRLFIHRNTLVYRLDKIKQEIGYDVRSFESAVLVRLLLLMYKVTKKL
ncbi:PucR family transcriptional regulator [Paenibacillus illinoisensis]|uniref:PucR family transcriptional regulator n=1 Tax=Paenibacillus illinoisensis TaxID=59845 RepID=UPI00204263A3|nr:PucR family transcriptional regulator [Paenibacillus illinoisensis]MCM3207634.1 helix-turn-helix domain-containing protein [Paenibacillus illinoisensis]